MKRWLMPLACAAALALPVFASQAQAGVASKSYDVTVVTTSFEFINDTVSFDDQGGVTTSELSGTYNNSFDLGFLSFFSMDLSDGGSPEFTVNLIGLQIQSIVIGRGADSDEVQWFYFGTESGQ